MTWRTETLGEICDRVSGVIRTGPFGSQLHEYDYVESGLPVVMPKNIIGGQVSVDDIAKIGEADVKRLAQHKLRQGDIVYGRRGDIGRRALIRVREQGWICGTGCLRISLGEKVLDPKFLYYYLGTPDITAWIYNQAVGATLPNLNTGIIRNVTISYPPLAIQRKIAAVLSAYDDLIENNARRIAILEEMARNLYREWFVEFRFPGHGDVRMVPSDIGDIPEHWNVVRATDAIHVNPTTKVSKDGQKPFVPMSGLSETSMLIRDIERRSGNSGSKFKNGDTLFARITPCLENGKTGYVQFLPTDKDVAFGSTEFIVLRSLSLCPEYVYLMARSDEFRDNAIKSMTGATGRQRVQEACFHTFFLAHPSANLLTAFQDHTQPIFKHIHMLSFKNSNLRRTRDLLLPRLVSGELDVEELNIDGGDDDVLTL